MKGSCGLAASFLAMLVCSQALEECPDAQATPNVRRLEQTPQHNHGRPGLSHMTVWGAKHHGMQELEVWLQTFGPGSGTPIHRHNCEEVFIVEAGEATYLLSHFDGRDDRPGESLIETASANSTFRVPPNAVHQVRNGHPTADLQVLVVISKPPIKVYTYESWDTLHESAVLSHPYPWDKSCPRDLPDPLAVESGREL